MNFWILYCFLTANALPSTALNRVLLNGKTLLLGWASCPLLTEGIAP